jgi:adenosylmethionine-8-amino-7-oxononanoate aminotransferase
VERLRESWLPEGLTRTFLTSGGSESVDSALRLARLHHVADGREGRWKVIGRDLSYHGTTLSTLAAGGSEKRRKGFEPLLQPWSKIPACYCFRCPLAKTYPQCGVACADELEALIQREGAETIAAFIAEPIVGSTAGALVPPDDYWPRIAEICQEHGILLIADEVMTGFGRTGKKFAVDHWGVTPDILVGGKGLAGGYAPMGGVFAKESVVAPLAQQHVEMMYFTFSAQPGACAAAESVLEILERDRLVERAAKMGERLQSRLRDLESHPHVAEVRGLGLLQAVELVQDKASGEPFPQKANVTARVVGTGLKKGVFFYPGGGTGSAPDVVVLGPPFVIEDDQIDEIVSVLERSIDAVTS